MRTARPVVMAALLAFIPSARAASDRVMRVDGGPFLMGSDRDELAEAPQHRLFLSPFSIDRHKVTNREFAAFLSAKGLKSPEGEDSYDWDDADAQIHRVTQIFMPDPGDVGFRCTTRPQGSTR